MASCRLGFCSLISCENEIQSRKWKIKSRIQFCTRAANVGTDTAGPIAPQPDVGSAHNLSRRQSVMSSCVCQTYGHFQCRVGKLLAPPCFFSVIAAHFCRGKSDGFSIRQKETQNRTKPQPTTGQISNTFGMNTNRVSRTSGPVLGPRGPRYPVYFGAGTRRVRYGTVRYGIMVLNVWYKKTIS